MDDISLIFKSLEFAAIRHRGQFRKGTDRAPYINHPIQVAGLLVNRAAEKDAVLISAAILHDVIEDTVTTEEEKHELISLMRDQFGEEVVAVTLEVTDDKSLDKSERKRMQVIHGPSLSDRAKKLKIADKIMNLHDISAHPPEWWSIERIVEYHDWAESVVNGMRGISPVLESIFDETLRDGRKKYGLKGEREG
jgi:GTP diphosphokinase / guanosine-3',5'-bis(diphosphate) 3'-diphosphatase